MDRTSRASAINAAAMTEVLTKSGAEITYFSFAECTLQLYAIAAPLMEEQDADLEN